MYTKEQMEAKEAECRTWREACELNRETLRDRFAMAALAGMMASPFDMDGDRETVTTHFATMSYSYADAMLQARDIRRTSGQSD